MLLKFQNGNNTGSNAMRYFEGNTLLTFIVSTKISKSTGHAVLQDTMDFLTTNELTFTG